MGQGERQIIHRYKALGKETQGKAPEELEVPERTFMEYLQ